MQIDVKAIVRQRVGRWVPGFVIRWLRRILHEAELNRYLDDYGALPPIHFIRACLREMGVSYRSEGLERLDPAGRYIFASNHPFGGMDGLMLADELSSAFGSVKVVVNDLLMNLAPLAPLFVPVNKHGRQSPQYARMYNEAFASAMPIATFPAGLCSRRIRGEVTDLPWKPSFVRRALQDRRDIVPVYCEGELSRRFYRLANIRKWLGIKVNIEMLLLPDEMFRQRGRTFRIRVGEPVGWRQIADGRPARTWCDEVRRRVYALKSGR